MYGMGFRLALAVETRNGAEFVKRIIAENAGNSKFNFLTPSDPYHAYYQHRLAEFRAQNENSASQPGDSVEPESAPPAPAPLSGAGGFRNGS